MNSYLENARQNFIQGMSRISSFWGFPRAMGAIYGAIYLSPTPLSLDEIVEQVGVTKGAVSTNVRQLERLRMVHKHIAKRETWFGFLFSLFRGMMDLDLYPMRGLKHALSMPRGTLCISNFHFTRVFAKTRGEVASKQRITIKPPAAQAS